MDKTGDAGSARNIATRGQRRHALRAGVALGAFALLRPAGAQTAVLRLIVPYPPGGVTDHTARLIAERLGPALNQKVIVENRPGASATLGLEALARSTPESPAIALSAISPLVLAPHLGRVPYDPQRDFAAVAAVMSSPVWMLATPLCAARDFAELIAQARARPESLRLATSGMGSVGHVMLEQLQIATGARFTHVPYKGGAQVMTDAASGQFELLFSNPGPMLNDLVTQGRLRPLALAAPGRLALAPRTPTFAELGVPAANLGSVFGVVAPAWMSGAQIARLHEALRQVLAQPPVMQRLQAMDNVPMTGSAEDFARLLREQSEVHARLVRQTGLRGDS